MEPFTIKQMQKLILVVLLIVFFVFGGIFIDQAKSLEEEKEVKSKVLIDIAACNSKYSERMNFKKSTSCDYKDHQRSMLLQDDTLDDGTTVVSAATLAFIPTIVGWAGFTKARIVGGSAKMMTSAAVANGGGVIAGSVSSSLQVIGATPGVVVNAPASGTVAVGVGLGSLVGSGVYYIYQNPNSANNQQNCNQNV